jgi:hypothetical protein
VYVCMCVCVYVCVCICVCVCVYVCMCVYWEREISVGCLVLLYLFLCLHYLIKAGLSQNVTKPKTCVLIFSTTFIWNISHSEKNWVTYYHYCTVHRSSCKIPLSDFNERLIFSTDFWNIPKYQNSRKSVHWEPSCSMQSVRQTDRQTWRS